MFLDGNVNEDIMKLQLSRVMIGSALITFMLVLGIAAATAADADQSEFVAIG